MRLRKTVLCASPGNRKGFRQDLGSQFSCPLFLKRVSKVSRERRGDENKHDYDFESTF